MAEYFDVVMFRTLAGYGTIGADAKLREIAEGVDKKKRDFLKLLVARGIDTKTTPSFVGTDWKPLAQSWIQRKKHDRYYFGMSEREGKASLKQSLLALPVEGVFGRTQVRSMVTPQTATAYPGFTVRGRVIKTVYRNTRGQFQQAWKSAPTTVTYTIDAFPNISWQNKNDTKLASLLGLDREQALKIEYNEGTRPLLVPFTEWFFLSKIKPYIESEMKKL